MKSPLAPLIHPDRPRTPCPHVTGVSFVSSGLTENLTSPTCATAAGLGTASQPGLSSEVDASWRDRYTQVHGQEPRDAQDTLALSPQLPVFASCKAKPPSKKPQQYLRLEILSAE